MSITLNKLINEELSKLSEKDRKLLKDKAKKQESKKFTKESLSQLIGEEFDKLTEGRMKKVSKSMWKKMKENDRVNALLSAFSDPDDAEEHWEKDWEDLPSVATSNMYLYEGKLNENITIKGKNTEKWIKDWGAGGRVNINNMIYKSLGKGKWKGPRGEKLSWKEVAAKAVELGDKGVFFEGKLNELSRLSFRDAGIKNLADLRLALDVARDNKIWWDQKDNQQALYFKNAKELKRFKKAYGLDEGKLNEVTAKATCENAVNALTKTIGGKKFDKGYVKDYLKQIERMARKNPGQFVKDYGDFKVGDWIEDVRYNMANESVNENVGAAYHALLKVSKDKKWIANVKKMSKSQLKKVSDQFTKDYHRGHIWTGSKEDMRKMQYVDALLKEGKLNEISVKAGLQDVLKGRTTSIEGIKISKGLAMAITTWIAQSSFGRKYNKQILKGRIGSLIKPMASWGLDRFLDSKTRPEWKQILSKHQRGIK